MLEFIDKDNKTIAKIESA
jgi:hypothetical protein